MSAEPYLKLSAWALARRLVYRLQGCGAEPAQFDGAMAAAGSFQLVRRSVGSAAPASEPRADRRAATILAVVGLQFEARIVASAGVRPVVLGSAPLAEAVLPTDRGVISFGICGGLATGLRPGACVIASSIFDGSRVWTTDAAWVRSLARLIPEAVIGPMLSLDAPILAIEEKARLHKSCGAVAVDMESYAAAAVAEARGLPFVVVRAVADDATCSLLTIAMAGRRDDGSVNVPGVLAALRRRPGDFGSLMRLAVRTGSARSTLVRLRPVLSRDFAFRTRFGHDLPLGGVSRPRGEQGEPGADRLQHELVRLGGNILE
jgi:Phosphorylase superfamily